MIMNGNGLVNMIIKFGDDQNQNYITEVIAFFVDEFGMDQVQVDQSNNGEYIIFGAVRRQRRPSKRDVLRIHRVVNVYFENV